MPSVVVPDEVKPALLILTTMPQQQFDGLIAALQELSPVTRSIPQVPDLSRHDAALIVSLIPQLEFGRSTFNWDIEPFVQITVATFAQEAALPNDKQRELATRLKQLMSFTAVGAPGRAAALIGEFERVLVDSRIITDIRPVFAENIDEGPTMFVLTQTLKLQFKEDDQYRDFFVSMDTSDLLNLRIACDRALAKSEHLPVVFPERFRGLWHGVSTKGED